jgi:hypothetical protein
MYGMLNLRLETTAINPGDAKNLSWTSSDEERKCPPLHKKIAVPFVRHRQGETDPEFFRVRASAAVRRLITFFNSSTRQYAGRAALRPPLNRPRRSRSNGCGFCDFDVRSLEIIQAGARLFSPRIRSEWKNRIEKDPRNSQMHVPSRCINDLLDYN